MIKSQIFNMERMTEESEEGSSLNKKAISIQENNRFILDSCTSREEFERAYKIVYEGIMKAEEFYYAVLFELKEQLLEGNLNNFKTQANLIYFISEIENKINLRTFYDNCKNPLKNTNIIILACKHNQVEILEYLFDENSKVLNNLSIDVGRDSILPDHVDNDGHNAFYYAIRSGSIKILHILINKWPADTYHFAVDFDKLNEILSRSYEELKLRNVPISDEMEVFVIDKLMEIRLDYSRQNQIIINDNHDSIRERIDLISQATSLLNKNYSESEDIDLRFLHLTKFIAKNIHILKQYLKSTYDRLPWEEMEFCLVTFISFHMKKHEIYLYTYAVLDKRNLLSFLKTFTKKLKDIKDLIMKINIRENKDFSKLNRDNVVADIISKYPQFEDLYITYNYIRNMCSIQKISDCINIAMLVDTMESDGQLVIMRALQVISEYSKNSLESPKLSNITSELILLSFPKKVRRIIIELRNSSNHVQTLSKRMAIEEIADTNFYVEVKGQIKTARVIINNILNRYKIKMVRILLKNLISSTSLPVTKVMKILSSINLDDVVKTNKQILDLDRIEYLITKLSLSIANKTKYEEDTFKKIYSVISSIRNKIVKIRTSFVTGYKSSKAVFIYFCDSEVKCMNVIKFYANKILGNIGDGLTFQNLKEIVILTLKISRSITSRIVNDIDKIFQPIYRILHMAQLAENDNKLAEEFVLNENDIFIPSRQELDGIYKIEEIHKVVNDTCKLESKISLLRCTLINSGLNYLNEDLYFYKQNSILQGMTEMLVFDILSILIDQSKCCLEKSVHFLDIDYPLLTGTSLLDYLACGNEIVDVLSWNPTIAILLNAKNLIKNCRLFQMNNENTSVISVDPNKIKDNYHRDLIIIANQEKMFNALEDGNLESFQYALKKGADINAIGNNSGTALHSAAKASLEAIKMIHKQKLTLSIKDINGKSPLHIACACGKKDITDYFLTETNLNMNSLDDHYKTPLHIAANNGHIHIVKILLENKALCMRDAAGFSPLYYAIKNNHINIVKLFIKNGTDDINEASGGFLPLFIAAEHGYSEIVNFLLENGAHVNTRNIDIFNFGETPLYGASVNGHLEIVKALVKKGGNVNVKFANDHTLLHYACENGHGKVVEFLLKNGAEIEAKDNVLKGRPLHYAADNGNENVVKILLKNNANVNAANNLGVIPLHLAVQSDSLKTVIALINHGADIHSKDMNFSTPLLYAAETGHKKIIDLLIKNKAEINRYDCKFRTPLFAAAVNGHKNAVSLLIKNKADINVQTLSGATPLHGAVSSGCKDVVEFLIKNNANINITARFYYTPFHLAIIEGHIDIIKLLIKHHAQVNPIEVSGSISMHAAVENGRKEVIKLLIECGADINVKCRSNLSPILYAVRNNCRNVIQVLLENGAYIDVEDSETLWALRVAVLFGFKDTLDIILNNRALVNITGPDDVTLLHLAVKKGYKEIVQSLLAKGANVNAQTAKRPSPLFFAVQAGHEEIVDILIKNGALVNITFTKKFTPLHVAAKKGYRNIVDALVKGGAEVDALSTGNTSPLFYAVLGGYEKTVSILAENGAHVNRILFKGLTMLHIAAIQGHGNMVKVLLKYGANVNVKDHLSRTPLYIAVIFGCQSVVELLLQCKEIDIKIEGTYDSIILHLAVTKNNLEMVRFLVNKGYDINSEFVAGVKPIHIAAFEGLTDIIEFFLSKGLNVNEPTRTKHTLLHCAIMKSQLEVVDYLIKRGADVNALDILHKTPLHTAAKFGHVNIIETLLKNGTNYQSRDIYNRKPSQVANDQIIANLLVSTENLFDVVTSDNYAEAVRLVKMGAFLNIKTAKYGTPLLYAAWKGSYKIVNVLLENKADPNLANDKGYAPLHYASAFSHRLIAIALLSHGAIYNAVSSSGKTPVDLAVDNSIMNVLGLVSESYKSVQNGNMNVIRDLNMMNDICLLRAVMNAQNAEGKTLVDVAVDNNFSEIEQLKQVLKTNEYIQISIAYLLFKKGNLKEALFILVRVFDKRKEILGFDNPHTLKVQLLIAYLQFRLNYYMEAFNLYNDISERTEKIYGPNNQIFLSSRSAIALILLRLGKLYEAFIVCQDIYLKQKEMLGKKNKEILNTQVLMALIMEKLGKFEEAFNMNKAVFEKGKKMLAPSDPSSISAANNLASILTKVGRYKDALKIYIDVYEKKKNININNLSIVITLQNITDVLMKLNKNNTASKFYEIVLNIFEIYFGKHHSKTLNSQHRLAIALLAGGQKAKALENFKGVFYAQIEILGPNNPTILEIFEKIKILHFYIKTLNVYVKTEEIQKKLKNSVQLQKFMSNAACSNDVKTIEILLVDGINVNDKDTDGRSPLFYAVSNGRVQACKLLLENGADATQTIDEESTLLHIAIFRNYKEIVEALLLSVKLEQFYEFINSKTISHGYTPLHVAASRGSFEITKCLLNHGASYDTHNIEGKKPINVSKDRRIDKLLKFIEELFGHAKNGDAIMFDMIKAARNYEFRAAKNTRNEKGITLLQVALVNKHNEIARKLLPLLK